ncbi:MAG: AraC family transcriptional regulator [Prevotella sp.]|nr:AraC family transcriptional regulator [Prevotella sp.]
MERRKLSEPEKLIGMTENPMSVSPDYLDDDLMIIDNIKLLGVPGGIRPNMNIIAICTQGKLQSTMNDAPFEVHARQIFICPAETTIGDLMVSPDFEYVALCITTRALQLYLRGYISVWNEFVYVRKKRLFDMTDADMMFYEKLYDLIRLCLEYPEEDSDKNYRREVMKGFLSTSLIGLCNLLQREIQTQVVAPKQNISLFNQFLDILQRQQVKHRPVEYYASQLCISPKYLTIICKKNSGKTANDWIREYTLADITYELRNTSQSVKEISNKLGFPNTSFFGKYVRDHLGCTPLEYRETTP